jgi:hypothetical protein
MWTTDASVDRSLGVSDCSAAVRESAKKEVNINAMGKFTPAFVAQPAVPAK